MRRCRICDCLFDPSNSHTHFIPPIEDTCKVCEDVILDTLQELEEWDEWKKEEEDVEVNTNRT